MSESESPQNKSRVVPGRYPPRGTNQYADAIRERRGERGLTPLDANLLHVPPIAGGYNSLMGAIRTKGSLPGDIREAMILRVAAINHAAFEWIQHEQIGRKEGLSSGQLYVIRDAQNPLPPSSTVLTHLQTAAVDYADHSTRNTRVSMPVILELKKQLKAWIVNRNPTLASDAIDAQVDNLYVEAVMVVSAYNMVSRFLLATDVAGLSDSEVPWPIEKKEHYISLPLDPHSSSPTHVIHATTLITSPTAPWIVFLNSLLTDWIMWSYVIPYLLDLPSSQATTYNILLHSQRGHGLSTLPRSKGDERLTTIPFLADDVTGLLDALSIPTPVHAVIGVSQGGAAALAFAASYPTKTKSIVACDTAPRTAAGNKEAWEERIRLVYGTSDPDSVAQSTNTNEYAKSIGMNKLAEITVPRWFPSPSSSNDNTGVLEKQLFWIKGMISRTDVAGFVHGAKALGDYDVISRSPPNSELEGALFDNFTGSVLLLAGSLDGGGKVGSGLKELRDTWNERRKHRLVIQGSDEVKFLEIEDAGHLPMISHPVQFSNVLVDWVQAI